MGNCRNQQLISRREKLISINNGLANKYFGNDQLIEKKKATIHSLFKAIRIESERLASIDYQKHKQSHLHQFLIGSKGFNGKQIMTGYSLQMSDINLLTNP
jgi:hypothetical protein